MVGPSLDDDARRDASRKLRYGFVALVAASGGLVAYQSGATLAGVGVATVAGLLIGVVLMKFLSRWFQQFAPDRADRERFRRP